MEKEERKDANTLSVAPQRRSDAGGGGGARSGKGSTRSKRASSTLPAVTVLQVRRCALVRTKQMKLRVFAVGVFVVAIVCVSAS